MSATRPLLVFVHINKTAGTTLRYILRSSYGARHCDVEPWHGAWVDPHSRPKTSAASASSIHVSRASRDTGSAATSICKRKEPTSGT